MTFLMRFIFNIVIFIFFPATVPGSTFVVSLSMQHVINLVWPYLLLCTHAIHIIWNS